MQIRTLICGIHAAANGGTGSCRERWSVVRGGGMATGETTGGASDRAEAGAPRQRRGGSTTSDAASPVVAGGGVLRGDSHDYRVGH